MLKGCAVFLTVLVCLLTLPAQENPTPPQTAAPAAPAIPAEAVRQPNPVKATPESIAQGKKYYTYDCALCHGENGDGKGDVAISEKLTLPDFTNPASLKDQTDGAVFYILKNGHGRMPAEAVRVNQNELWNLINYVRSLANKKGQ